ncbi:MAG: 6-phosphofructokinase [Planctomycetales bacterium]|nr:6-phosphofructokinase [Planctomycetales bacterium]
MSQPKNLVVAQSGGPSPVINNTLRGIVEMARDCQEIGKVYAARHGIEGVLREELLDLSAQCPDEVSLLRYTPAAGSIGTCRYKLLSNQQEDFERVIDVLRAHDVGYFIYIGGNDSMDTANKIAQLGQARGLDLVGIGGPKTIDNDVGDTEFKLIDHTPGYGSAAKYWMHAVQNANEENRGSCPADPVLVMQAMGRKIGFIPAAARLADPHREMPLQIYMAENPCSLEQLASQVNDQLRADGRCLVVISEGFDVGDLG